MTDCYFSQWMGWREPASLDLLYVVGEKGPILSHHHNMEYSIDQLDMALECVPMNNTFSVKNTAVKPSLSAKRATPK